MDDVEDDIEQMMQDNEKNMCTVRTCTLCVLRVVLFTSGKLCQLELVFSYWKK